MKKIYNFVVVSFLSLIIANSFDSKNKPIYSCFINSNDETNLFLEQEEKK